MSYFEKFPLINYRDSTTGVIRTVTDILKRVGIKKSLYNSVIEYYTEQIYTKDRPEVFSATLYDDPHKYWINMMANHVIDPYYDWVLSDENFSAMIKEKYPNKYVILGNVALDNYPIIGETLQSTEGGANVIDFMPLPKIENESSSQLIISADLSDGIVGYTIPYASVWVDSTTGDEINAIHHVEKISTPTEVEGQDVLGNPITKITGYTSSYQTVSNLEYEISKNESNNSINAVDSNLVDEIESQLGSLFK
jgi:hypothetical protein